uniref:Membrane protein BRI3 n=1 Tax=Cyprinus carpio TaxID=7962 RepID=A0A8C1MWB4_CYPCA
MDTKPLLQDRPPAYNTVPAAYDYGSVPAAGFQPPAPPVNIYIYIYNTIFQGGYPAAPAPPAAIATQPAYTSTYTIVQPSVVVVGGCPACRVGVLEEDFTCLGIMCAIFFFPLGILFCLALRQRRCPNCGATFG